MKAVVTGGTGCVGYHVVRELLLQGWEVTIFHRKTSNISMFGTFGQNVNLVTVDLYDYEATLNVLPKNIDAVFHLAANVSHHTDRNQWNDNVLVTRNLLQASLEKGVKRFIFTSTAAARFARNSSSESNLRSEVPCGYAYTKRLAEIEAMNAVDRGLDVVILQPTIVLGEYDFHHNYSQLFENTILTRLRAALPGSLEFADAKKIAQAHVAAYHNGMSDSFYVLGGEYLSWFELQKIIANVTGLKPPLFTLPKWFLYIIAMMHKIGHMLFRVPPQMTTDLIWLLGYEDPVQRPDDRRAIRDLGYDRAKTDIRTVCRKMHKWIKQNS